MRTARANGVTTYCATATDKAGNTAKIPRRTRTVSFPRSLHKQTFWVIGIRAADVLHRITIRVG